MNRYAPAPQYALVFDVNTLIDAVDQTSRHHDAAVRALTSSNGQPVYFSDHMLRTTAHELLRLGAEPGVVQEYLEFVTISEEEFGPEIHTFTRIEFTDYEIFDRPGNPDREDATIISLMDAAEGHARRPALLVTTDGGLQEWCRDNRRKAVFPNSLQRLLGQHQNEYQADSFEYMSRRMFPRTSRGARLAPSAELREMVRHIVASLRGGADAPQAETQTNSSLREVPRDRQISSTARRAAQTAALRSAARQTQTYTPSIPIDYGDAEGSEREP